MSKNRSQKQKTGTEFEVILTHEHADFDAMASLLAASLIYPQSLPVYPYWVNRNVRDFLAEHQHQIAFVRARDLPRGHVTRAILVDTLRANQVKGMTDETAFLAIDHHTRQTAPPEGWALWSEPVGANVTLLIEELIDQQQQLTPAQATLMALAIHEDTGSLTYPSATARDAQCLAWLLEEGADLKTILRYVNHPLNQSQRDLLDTLIEQCEFIERSGYAIAIAQAEIDSFHSEFSTLIARLRDRYDLDAAFLLIQRGDVVHMVARSTKDAFDVGAIARELGGDGHRRASAAPVRNGISKELRDQIVSQLEQQLEAQQVDVSEADPPKIAPSQTEAQSPLGTAGSLEKSNGMEQVLPPEQLHILRLLGEVAEELAQQLYVVGGFVRDLYYQHHLPNGSSSQYATNFDLDIVIEGSRLDAGDFADAAKTLPVDAIDFAEEVVRRFGGRLIPHKRFGTAKWILDDVDNPVDTEALFGQKFSRSIGRPSSAKAAHLPPHLDFVSARTEFYSAPTELPTVQRGNIDLDLRRRDFTINTMALALTPTRWSELLDHFGGLHDLQQGIIRVLHSRSFVDDPTRMVRAVRYEQRFGFHIEPQTEQLLHDARSLLQRLTPARIRHELERIFHERLPEGALSRLQELGLLEEIHPALDINMQIRNDFLRLREALATANKKVDDKSIADDLLCTAPIERLYWGLLIAPHSPEVDVALTEKLTLRVETQRLMGGMRTMQRYREQLVDPAFSVSSTVTILDGVDPVAVALVHATSTRQLLVQRLERYLTHWREVKPLLNGNDLEALGVARGPEFRKILTALRMGRLDGLLGSRDDEVAYVGQWLENQAN